MKTTGSTCWSSTICMVLLVVAFSVPVSAYKVLLLPLAGKSHVMSMAAIAEGLAGRGHKVTLYIGENFPLSFPELVNRTEVNVVRYRDTTDGGYVDFNAVEENITKSAIECGSDKQRLSAAVRFQLSRKWCQHITVDNEDNLDKLEKEKFDAAVVDGIFFAKCKYLIPHRLQIPWITYSDAVDPLAVRVPWLPSFVPSYIFPATERMTFVERLQNAIALFAFTFVVPLKYPEPSQEVLNKFRRYGSFGSLDDLVSESALWFLTKGTVLDYPRPAMPNMVNIGGLTVQRSTGHLPAEIGEFVDGARKGVILMTFGTMASNMPAATVEKFSAAFRRLDDYGVIWRLNNKDNVKLPQNVMTARWLPQQDILAHPSVRLFITHSGNNGQYEAIYHAVPMLGLPIFGDQMYNAKRLDHKGYGLSMDLCDFTADQLYDNILKILRDKSYKERVTKASEIFRSQAQNPVERATFWIEYICRFGGEHLRSAGNDLPLYSYLLLDVLAFILITLLVVSFLIFTCVNILLRKCCGQRIQTTEVTNAKKTN